MTKVLSFDIGIRNLAYCLLETKEKDETILAWDNVSLLTETVSTAQTCAKCKSKAKFQELDKVFCGKHTHLLALKDASGNLYKKIPTLSTAQEILKTKHNMKVVQKKESILEALSKFYSIPLVAEKKVNAKEASLEIIHDGIRALVTTHKTLWQTCTLICLENQPAFKNPHMKSVQMLLYATLRDMLENPPPIKLVHAGKKVQGMTKGDEGYKDRKAGSEERAKKFLEKPAQQHTQWKKLYESAKKKNDLADALCMSIDHAY